MFGQHRTSVVALATLALTASFACQDAGTEPGSRGPAAASLTVVDTSATDAGASVTESGPKLLKCAARSAASVRKQLDDLGGDVAVGANRLSVPNGAVNGPTTFELVVPATNRAQVDLSANGLEHFAFGKPVAISIDLGHCTDAELAGGPLSVWYIDAQTGALLQEMGGSFDAVAKSITFWTTHFSSYAVAH
jgi:hypothetical protein